MTKSYIDWTPPEPYHKRTRKTCPVKDIPALLDQLDNDDLNGHFRKEDRE